MNKKEDNKIVATKENPLVMSLSDNTLKVLQNFGQFAPHFASDESDHLRCLVPGVLVIYELPENERLPDFQIGSIPKFMNSCDAFKKEERLFSFTDRFVQISDDSSFLRYLFVEKEILHLSKSYDMPSSMFKGYSKYKSNFKLDPEVMGNLKKVSSYMGLGLLSVEVIDGKGTLTLSNPAVGFDSLYSHDIVGEGTCSINIMVENMKFINGTYNCSFDETRIQFLNDDIPLRYIIVESKVDVKRK